MSGTHTFTAAHASIDAWCLLCEGVSLQPATQPGFRYELTIDALVGPAQLVDEFIVACSSARGPFDLVLRLATGVVVELTGATLCMVGFGAVTAGQSIRERLHFFAIDVRYCETKPDGRMPDTQIPAIAMDGERSDVIGASMSSISFSQFATEASRYQGMIVRDCGNGHWQASLNGGVVNVYPFAHPPKYLLQIPGMQGREMQGEVIEQTVAEALANLYTIASQSPQETQSTASAAAPTTESAHTTAAAVKAEHEAFRQFVADKLSTMPGMKDVVVNYRTEIVVIGEDSDNLGDFLVGKLDGMRTAYKLVAELGAPGIELLGKQIEALAESLNPANNAEAAQQPAAAG